MPIPACNEAGDLPPGIHPAILSEVVARFGRGSVRRHQVSSRLERIYHIAMSSGQVSRLILFGSFITTKPDPNDVDLFFLMEDTFDVSHLTGELKILFDHAAAQAHYGASVFWVRNMAALGGAASAIEHWGIKRGGGVRGLVEIISE